MQSNLIKTIITIIINAIVKNEQSLTIFHWTTAI